MKVFSPLLAVGLLLSVSSSADPLVDDPKLAEHGWHHLLFDNKTPNDYRQESDGSIRVESSKSVSLIYRNVDVSLSTTPTLKWSWKVNQTPPIGDLSVKGKDDRALALYVSFPFDEENANFFERFVRSIVVALKGEDAPGRVISYVWGGNEAISSTLESPYLKDAGALIVLQNDQSRKDQWFNEQVNVLADYERIFGVRALSPYQIAISADSDDSRSQSLGWVKGLEFTP